MLIHFAGGLVCDAWTKQAFPYYQKKLGDDELDVASFSSVTALRKTLCAETSR